MKLWRVTQLPVKCFAYWTTICDEYTLLLRANLRAEIRKRGIADSVGAVGELLTIDHFCKTSGLPNLRLTYNTSA